VINDAREHGRESAQKRTSIFEASAVFKSVPKSAMVFYNALACDDHVTISRLIDRFFLPYLENRNRREGYAVSIIKAGVRLIGHDAGPVRPPLVELPVEETECLQTLIKAPEPQ
jgi:5-dehydro-4-deoxyglucarate dehydratase